MLAWFPQECDGWLACVKASMVYNPQEMRRVEERTTTALMVLQAAEAAEIAAAERLDQQEHRAGVLDAAWDSAKRLLELLCEDNSKVKDRFCAAGLMPLLLRMSEEQEQTLTYTGEEKVWAVQMMIGLLKGSSSRCNVFLDCGAPGRDPAPPRASLLLSYVRSVLCYLLSSPSLPSSKCGGGIRFAAQRLICAGGLDYLVHHVSFYQKRNADAARAELDREEAEAEEAAQQALVEAAEAEEAEKQAAKEWEDVQEAERELAAAEAAVAAREDGADDRLLNAMERLDRETAEFEAAKARALAERAEANEAARSASREVRSPRPGAASLAASRWPRPCTRSPA